MRAPPYIQNPSFSPSLLALFFFLKSHTEILVAPQNSNPLRHLLKSHRAMAAESPKVQHVSKAASDKLLVKFSDVSVYDFVYSENGIRSPALSSSKGGNPKKKRGAEGKGTESSPLKSITNVNVSRELDSIVTWKTPLNGNVRKQGFSSHLRSAGNLKSSRVTAAQIKTYALISTAAEKAWRKALRGATRCLMERHAAQPVRLRKELL